MRPSALLLLPLLAAACRTEPAAPPPAPEPALSTSPAPPPAAPGPDAAPPPVDTPADGVWTIRADGAGPLRIGMTSAAATAAARQRVVPDTADFGAQCAYASVRMPSGGRLAVMFSDGRIVRVEPGVQAVGTEVEVSAVRSADGFGVGTTEAQVRARYPNLRAEGHAYVPGGKYLVTHPLPDTTLKIVYETDEQGVVTLLRGGRDPFVGYVEGCA